MVYISLKMLYNYLNDIKLFIIPLLMLATSCKQTKSITRAPVLKNPVLNKDFPDPTVILANGIYYAYATQALVNGRIWNMQVASSPNLTQWTLFGDALPQKPVWADSTQDFWAPHVLYDAGLNKYVMFYSGESDDTTTGKCLGVAFANDPAGPFTDKGSPLLCGEGFVNIDPMAFTDPQSGKKLLYWGSGFGPIKVQAMNDDWKSFKVSNSEQPIVWPGKKSAYTKLLEGAWVDYVNNTYYLYYSGDNCCGDKANYAVMVAKSENPYGPFESLGEATGTGRSVMLEKDEKWLAYHAIDRDNWAGGNSAQPRVFV